MSKLSTMLAGHDPDTFLREQGPQAFLKLIESKFRLFDFSHGTSFP